MKNKNRFIDEIDRQLYEDSSLEKACFLYREYHRKRNSLTDLWTESSDYDEEYEQLKEAEDWLKTYVFYRCMETTGYDLIFDADYPYWRKQS